ncbi:hypothetical protein PI125_g14997 [Phytophthora idaei]|nr:hypothetical protein PI125_g14997 [Phytophthora idaei]
MSPSQVSPSSLDELRRSRRRGFAPTTIAIAARWGVENRERIQMDTEGSLHREFFQ